MKLYDMGLTNGKVINGQTPKTYESYGPKDTLTRAEVATFLYRLYGTQGNVSLPINETIVQTEAEIERIEAENKYTVTAKGVKLGLTQAQVEKLVGKATFTSVSDYGMEWHYHYDSNWKNFVKVAYKNGKVAQLFSNQSILTGVKIGMTNKDAMKFLGVTKSVFSDDDYVVYELKDRFVVVMKDLHNKETVSGVFVTTKEAEALKPSYYAKGSAKLERSFEKQVWVLTNTRRVEQGLKPLTWSDKAQVSSYKHSLDMLKNDYFDHVNLKGQSPFDRMMYEGISYSYASENIAFGQQSPIFVVEAG